MTINELLKLRFNDTPDTADTLPLHGSIAGHRSCRAFRAEPVDDGLLRTLCALALCTPTKSDLQQRDIVIIRDAELRQRINSLLADQTWVASAPAFLVFLGNNRRQRLLHEWRGRPFANDHLDAFFNPAVDAGIALGGFVIAAEAAGLGTCPVSAIRNHSPEVSDLLGLPDHVFPVAGLGVGWPESTGGVNLRLPLAATVHTDRYDEAGLRRQVEDYDARRRAHWPYRNQRMVETYGTDDAYGWSEDKARQYSREERADFGNFIRAKGFKLF